MWNNPEQRLNVRIWPRLRENASSALAEFDVGPTAIWRRAPLPIDLVEKRLGSQAVAVSVFFLRIP